MGSSCISLYSLQEWTFPTSLLTFVGDSAPAFYTQHNAKNKTKQKSPQFSPSPPNSRHRIVSHVPSTESQYFAVIYVSVWFSWLWVPYGQDLFSFFHVFLAPWCDTWYLIALKQSLMSEWMREWTNEQLVWLTLNLQRLVWLNRGRL